MHEVNLVSYPTREAWLAARAGGVGASESAALFGVSRWDSALSLWTKKRGLVDDDADENERLEIGLLMEPTIASLYHKRTGRVLWAPQTPWTIARHPRVPCMTASVDRWVIEADDKDGRGVLELKNVDLSQVQEWEEGPPLPYQIQFQHQLAVTGFKWGSVAGLIGGNRFRMFDIQRDDGFISELEQICVDFWGKVERGEMPPPDGSEATAKALKRLHPLDTGGGVHLKPEHVPLWDELCAIRKRKAADEKREKEIKNLLAHAVGGATYGLLPDGRLVSYKHQSRDGYTVEPVTFRVFKEEKIRASDKTMKELIAASSVGQALAQR